MGSAYVTGCMNLPAHKLSKHLYAMAFTFLVSKILQPWCLRFVERDISSNLGFCLSNEFIIRLCFSANFAIVREPSIFQRSYDVFRRCELWRTLHLSHSWSCCTIDRVWTFSHRTKITTIRDRNLWAPGERRDKGETPRAWSPGFTLDWLL